jgi:hypothetical protein
MGFAIHKKHYFLDSGQERKNENQIVHTGPYSRNRVCPDGLEGGRR